MEHTMEELATLLHYLVKHNEDHAAEIMELADRARDLGQEDAYDQLVLGVRLLRDSNASLQAALVTMEVRSVSS
jgi:hypothetical protein